MSDIRAFRAHRYDLGSCGAFSDVVAPPYDVIDPALHKQLLERSPYNAVRIDLPFEDPNDDDSRNRYTRSAALLREWIGAGTTGSTQGRHHR